MKYDFICITQNATRSIVQSRSLQSVDFKNSSFIIDISNGDLPTIENNELPIHCTTKNKGVYIVHDDDSYLPERNTITLDFKSLTELL